MHKPSLETNISAATNGQYHCFKIQYSLEYQIKSSYQIDLRDPHRYENGNQWDDSRAGASWLNAI